MASHDLPWKYERFREATMDVIPKPKFIVCVFTSIENSPDPYIKQLMLHFKNVI